MMLMLADASLTHTHTYSFWRGILATNRVRPVVAPGPGPFRRLDAPDGGSSQRKAEHEQGTAAQLRLEIVVSENRESHFTGY